MVLVALLVTSKANSFVTVIRATVKMAYDTRTRI